MLHNQHLSLVLLKPYFRLALLLLTGFAAVGMGAAALGRNAPPSLNPFEAYLDIFPGQPMSAVVKRGISCWFVENYYATPTQEHCVLTPAVGIISAIEVTGFNRSVRQIKFTLRENTLRLGDLLVMYNVSGFRAYSNTTFGFWREYFVTAPIKGKVDLNPVSQPVWSVAFTQFVTAPAG